MSKVDSYRTMLRSLSAWDAYLLRESGLPGPRGNLELAQVVAQEGDAALFARYAILGPDVAPEGSPEEFLAFCGVLGLGKLAAEGQTEALAQLRRHAADPRWRLREAVAMALQRFGDADMDALIGHMRVWSRGSFLEQRAAAAALCEPRLLRNQEHVRQVLVILDAITASLAQAADRKGDEFRALRKGLAYCWSVAVAAFPEAGKPLMERWFASEDRDIRWIMKENLRKNRLVRMDARWVESWVSEYNCWAR